jgi:hypothetical protein
MERQRHLLGRDTPPKITFIVDELALYRRVGDAEVMTVQLRRLRESAEMPWLPSRCCQPSPVCA